MSEINQNISKSTINLLAANLMFALSIITEKELFPDKEEYNCFGPNNHALLQSYSEIEQAYTQWLMAVFNSNLSDELKNIEHICSRFPRLKGDLSVNNIHYHLFIRRAFSTRVLTLGLSLWPRRQAFNSVSIYEDQAIDALINRLYKIDPSPLFDYVDKGQFGWFTDFCSEYVKLLN